MFNALKVIMQPPSVLIGRFQPFHEGHARLLAAGLKGGGEVLVVLGSHGRPRSPRNPFTSAEREAMIRSTLSPSEQGRVYVVPVEDHLYDEERWRQVVMSVAKPIANGGPIRLIGLRKDNTSAYLDDFPGWPLLKVPGLAGISGSDIRAAWLEGKQGWDRHLAPQVREWLLGFEATQAFAWLQEEHLALKAYRERWSRAPYVPVLVTVDVLAHHLDSVLLVRRGKAPGKGLMALPGGFLDPGERLVEAARRELLEETGLQLGAGHSSFLEPTGVFDHPLRSERGRMISHVYRADLSDEPLPRVIGGDDAASAQWVPLEEALNHPEWFFDDHHEILSLLMATKA